MKALAKNKETGEAQEIDIIASIRGGIPRVIVDYPGCGKISVRRKVYESPEDIGKDWEIISAPELYKNPTGLDYPELMRHYSELYAHVLGMYRDRILKDLL